jgi:hypothetical protein
LYFKHLSSKASTCSSGTSVAQRFGQKAGRKEGKLMPEQILVALKSHDRLSRMVPYIEEVAKPGMKVVLLIPNGREAAFNTSQYNSSMANSFAEERSLHQLEDAIGRTFDITGAQMLEKQIVRAEHKTFMALERLLKKGIDITVDVYTGSLRSVLKSYTVKGNVHLIMKRAGRALMMMQFFRRAVPNFVVLKPPSFSSIRMLRPNEAV